MENKTSFNAQIIIEEIWFLPAGKIPIFNFLLNMEYLYLNLDFFCLAQVVLNEYGDYYQLPSMLDLCRGDFRSANILAFINLKFLWTEFRKFICSDCHLYIQLDITLRQFSFENNHPNEPIASNTLILDADEKTTWK